MKNKILSFSALGLLLLTLIMNSVFPVFAGKTEYSLTLNCMVKENEENKALAGDTFAIVKLADCAVTEKDNNHILKYSTVKRFSDYDCEWEKLSASQLRDKAAEIALMINSKDYVDIKTTDKQGHACFNLKETGLYLVVRTKTANSDVLFDAYIISVPQIINGQIIYNVTSAPKLVKTKSENNSSDKNNYIGNKELTGNGTRLPQTGQIILPMLLLAGFGFLMIIIGLYLLKSGKKNEED